ncbi:hypothetical protein PMAYCL1PPCAC_26311, partial [Pristionchus mayeri]
CDYHLDVSVWGYVSRGEQRCTDFRSYTFFSRYVAMIITVAVLDIASVIKVRHIQKSRIRVASMRKKSLEYRLLYQACSQASLFIVDVLSVCIILPRFERNQWARLISTLVWISAMGADGALIYAFNKELRNVVCNAIRCKISSVSPSTKMTRFSQYRSRNENA